MKKIKFITHSEVNKLLTMNCIKSNKLSGGQINFLKAVKAMTPENKKFHNRRIL